MRANMWNPGAARAGNVKEFKSSQKLLKVVNSFQFSPKYLYNFHAGATLLLCPPVIL